MDRNVTPSIEPDVSTSTSTSSLGDDIKTCAPTSNSLPQEAHKILIDQQFPGIDILKIYNYSLCSSCGCSSFSAEERKRQSNLKETFDHAWLNNSNLSYCIATRLWDFIFIEGDGLYCMLCKKHDMKNPRNKSTVFSQESSKRFRKGTLTDHLKYKNRQDAKSSEVLNRVSAFQKEVDHKESVNQDILLTTYPSVLRIFQY